ncbi:MAG: Methylmalonyl-CoA carboxyltransferase [Acidimicrobiales bacterium]|nr:Methylmalonyl-CoA carboxyltransferase [Acidimicrobiales bacterium]
MTPAPPPASLLDASLGRPTPLAADRPSAATAVLTELDGRTVALFRVHGAGATADGSVEAEVVVRAFEIATEAGCPVVGLVHSVVVPPTEGGLAGLVAWGRVAQRAVALSGVVPLILVVTGPCHGGLAPLFGLADHVVLVRGATTYINGPKPVAAVTGLRRTPEDLGGAAVHATVTGLASLLADDEEDALAAVAELLHHLPDNNLSEPPPGPTDDPTDRACSAGPAAVPASPSAAYDVRDVIEDVVDRGSFLEVHAHHAPNMVTGYARIGSRSIAIVANQPWVRAGTIDIAASVKAARHVQAADSAGLPIVTFVDTPGYEPGRDLEWRGMIRHGAKLVHAYGEAVVPRICVILRKAYGGAYIVMDSRDLGSDLVLAWPGAEIAVMGAPGAVAILNRREIASAADPEAERLRLEDEYRLAYCTPRIAAERGYVDQVIDPADTRRIVAAALERLRHKRRERPARRHSNGPL